MLLCSGRQRRRRAVAALPPARDSIGDGNWRVPASFGCDKAEVLAQLQTPPLTAAEVACLQSGRAVLFGAGDSPLYACVCCTCSGWSNEVRGNARLEEFRLFMTKPCPAACMPLTAADASAHAHLVPHVQPTCQAAALPLSVCGAPTLVGLYPGCLSRGRWRLALAQAVCSVASAALAPEAPGT